jgi:RHS repeat-associated protein
VWDQSGSLPLVLSDGTNNYVYGPGGLPLEQISGSTISYFHQDQLGSTRALTNAGGSPVATYSYDAYGKVSASTGSVTTPLGFTGQYTDAESGLTYMRARYYDPATGQFLSKDPITAKTGEPYGYAGNDPLNRRDPSGLCNDPIGYEGPVIPCPGDLPPDSPNDDGRPAYYYVCGTLWVVEGCIEVTRGGGAFVTGGLGLGTPGVSGGAGYLNGNSNPPACETNKFLSGPSVNAGGGAVIGGNAVWGNEGGFNRSDTGYEIGLTTPGAGTFQENTWGIAGNTSTRGCGCS